jgi:hypothetical protein
MFKMVMLYEWIDENGEVEDFIVIDAFSKEENFFKFPEAISSYHFDEEAVALLRDYKEK